MRSVYVFNARVVEEYFFIRASPPARKHLCIVLKLFNHIEVRGYYVCFNVKCSVFFQENVFPTISTFGAFPSVYKNGVLDTDVKLSKNGTGLYNAWSCHLWHSPLHTRLLYKNALRHLHVEIISIRGLEIK